MVPRDERRYSSQVVRQVPHVRPAPNPTSSSVSPFCSRPVSLRFGEAERDRRARRVAVAIEVVEDLLLAKAEPARGVVDDAQVGLVRHEQVDVGDPDAGLGEHVGARLDHLACGELVDLGPVHLQVVLARVDRLVAGRHPRPARRQVEERRPGAVVAEVEVEPRAVVARAHQGRPGAVAEEDAGGAVLPVEGAGQRLGADDQHMAGQTGADETDRRREPVHVAGAARLNVEGAGVARRRCPPRSPRPWPGRSCRAPGSSRRRGRRRRGRSRARRDTPWRRRSRGRKETPHRRRHDAP